MQITPKTTYKIRFTDCDLLGHLNNSKYIDYLLNAREDHLQEIYRINLNEYYKQNVAWVITNNNISYLRPAFYNEIITIQTSVIGVGDDLLQIELIMLNEKCTHLKAVMWSSLSSINLKTGSKVPHPILFKEWAYSVLNTEIDYTAGLQERIKRISKTLN